MSSASNDDGRRSSSHVLIAVLFNTSRTVDADTGWKAVSGDPSRPMRVMEVISHRTSAEEVQME